MELKPRILVKADTFHIPGTNEQELSQRYKPGSLENGNTDY